MTTESHLTSTTHSMALAHNRPLPPLISELNSEPARFWASLHIHTEVGMTMTWLWNAISLGLRSTTPILGAVFRSDVFPGPFDSSTATHRICGMKIDAGGGIRLQAEVLDTAQGEDLGRLLVSPVGVRLGFVPRIEDGSLTAVNIVVHP